MVKEISALELRQHFGEIMEEVRYRREPYVVKRNNRPMVVILDIDAYEAVKSWLEEGVFIEEYSEERIAEFLQEDRLGQAPRTKARRLLGRIASVLSAKNRGGPDAPFGGHESSAIRAVKAWRNSGRRKFFSPEPSGPERTLQLLRDRGWENPAKGSKQRTGWAPASGLRRVVGRRPAEGKANFLVLRGV